MTTALFPHAIGVSVHDLPEALQAARTGGFDGVEFSIQEAERRGTDEVRRLTDEAGVRLAGWGFPLEWRGDEGAYRRSLEEVPGWAKTAQALGADRTYTWILPMSDERDFDANYRFHVERLRPAAAMLADHGIRFGLEFVGPKTLRDAGRYPFVYDQKGMLSLAEEVGPNVGLLVDSFHWYTSGGTAEELGSLRAEQVVYVHVNDALPRRGPDEQIDNERALPLENGVIDLATFMRTLARIGYDGPVVTEPFKKGLADLPSDEERLRVVGEATRRAVALADGAA